MYLLHCCHNSCHCSSTYEPSVSLQGSEHNHVMSKQNLPLSSPLAWIPTSINSSRLRCEAVSFREWFRTFRKTVVLSSSRPRRGPQISHFAIRARSGACAAVLFGSSHFWVVKHCRLVSYRRFGTEYRYNFNSQEILTLEDVPERRESTNLHWATTKRTKISSHFLIFCSNPLYSSRLLRAHFYCQSWCRILCSMVNEVTAGFINSLP